MTKHQYQPVNTEDLKKAIEEETGQNLTWFFDEWVYKAGHPVFDVSYKWNEDAGQILLSVKQTQKMDSLTGVFKMPVDIEITAPSGVTSKRIGILKEDSTYALPSAGKPLLVIFDGGDNLIKELRFGNRSTNGTIRHCTQAILLTGSWQSKALSVSENRETWLPS